MNLCDDGHDEICYEVVSCPACLLKDELADTKADVRNLQEVLRVFEEG
jgi:hypothetical protein